jgi:transglutaminase-like putative cysteine protease
VTWRMEINHVTHYNYARPVAASYNEARVTPLTTPDQLTVDARVTVEPATELFSYWDYWGTLVHAFDVHEPHDCLVVTSKSVVETAAGTGGRATGPSNSSKGSATWRDLEGNGTKDRFFELLSPSRLVSTEELAEQAGELRACQRPAEAVEIAITWAHRQLEYGAGATHVGTSAVEAWKVGRGVCQDFAHLSLAVLRAAGIPARYVSGYFYPSAEGRVGVTVMGESHAWVEAWTGAWEPHDPTNLVSVAERHVTVARGRDYADVPPLRGVYSGPPGSSSEVAVELARIA